MTKKLGALVLILAAVFTLTACDSVNDGSGRGELVEDDFSGTYQGIIVEKGTKTELENNIVLENNTK